MRIVRAQIIAILILAIAIIVLALAPRATATDDMVRSVISEADEIRLAQMLYGEDRNCGDSEDTMKQAAVIWCAFNRCDAWEQTITETITHSQFHGWHREQRHPEWAHVIVRDVAYRYALERCGMENVGRVLPKSYLFFSNNGRHNKFREEYRRREYWDWNAENPYCEGE